MSNALTEIKSNACINGYKTSNIPECDGIIKNTMENSVLSFSIKIVGVSITCMFVLFVATYLSVPESSSSKFTPIVILLLVIMLSSVSSALVNIYKYYQTKKQMDKCYKIAPTCTYSPIK